MTDRHAGWSHCGSSLFSCLVRALSAQPRRIRAEDRIEGLDAAEVGADRGVLYGAPMVDNALSHVPRTAILRPGDGVLGRGKVDIHIGAAQALQRVAQAQNSPRLGTMQMNSKEGASTASKWWTSPSGT